jgi:hypothetical protein
MVDLRQIARRSGPADSHLLTPKSYLAGFFLVFERYNCKTDLSLGLFNDALAAEVVIHVALMVLFRIPKEILEECHSTLCLLILSNSFRLTIPGFHSAVTWCYTTSPRDAELLKKLKISHLKQTWIKESVGRSRHWWKNIIKTNLKETGSDMWTGFIWLKRVPVAGSLLINSAIISFSRILFQIVNKNYVKPVCRQVPYRLLKHQVLSYFSPVHAS